LTGARHALAAALALLCVSPAGAAAPPPDRERLDALRGRIERLRSALAESEEDRSEARNELRDSERAISEANRSVRELAGQRTAAQGELRMFTAARAKTQASIAARERELGRLLAALYMAGDPGYLKVMLSGADPGQTARDLHYLGYLSRAHAALAASLRDELARLEELEARVKASVAEAAELERSQRDARAELLKQRGARRAVFERVSAKIRTQRREVDLLSRDEARLSRLVTELSRLLVSPQDTPRGPGAFPTLKGRLRLPLQGVVAHRFGAPRADGGPPWKGMFIRAAAGTEVRAAAEGQVVFADWMRGYGNILIIDHGGGYLSVYGNNESVLKTVGERVGVKDVIATVGASGGGEETGLYFEVRHEGRAFDPMTWVALR